MPLQLSFLGAAGEVTGSCHLLQAGGHKLLLDCGMFQGPPETEARNAEAFPFEPQQLAAVILSHAHLDHSGRLPLLVKRGFRGPIYTHPATRDLCRIMLMDAAHIAQADAETESRKRARRGLPPVTPLYTLDDVDNCMQHFRSLHYGERQELLPGIACRLRDAGHILGAAVIELWAEDGVRRKLVFSGDLGHRGSFIMPPPQTVEEADLLIMESAYGDRLHKTPAATLQEVGAILRAAQASGGNLLIPAFAVGRAQELLYILAQHAREWELDRWQLFLDSPMAIHATEIYTAHAGFLNPEAARFARQHHFQPPQIRFTLTARESEAINRLERGAIIVAGSGMCSGGRILHHLKHHAWRAQDHLMFVGFQASGTLGRRIVDGAKEIRLWDEPIRVAAQVHTVGGFSAHADQRGLCDWYRAFTRPPRVALVHGEPPASRALAEALRRSGAEVVIPARGDRLDLAAVAAAA